MASGEDLIASTASILRDKFGSDWGIVDIRSTNRFGENVVAVRFVSREDYERLHLELSKASRGQLYFHYPLWPIGGLIQGNTAQVEKILLAPIDANDTEAMKRRERAVEAFVSQDQKVWDSWSPAQRRAFVKSFIEQKRAQSSGFANCGDKFMLPN